MDREKYSKSVYVVFIYVAYILLFSVLNAMEHKDVMIETPGNEENISKEDVKRKKELEKIEKKISNNIKNIEKIKSDKKISDKWDEEEKNNYYESIEKKIKKIEEENDILRNEKKILETDGVERLKEYRDNYKKEKKKKERKEKEVKRIEKMINNNCIKIDKNNEKINDLNKKIDNLDTVEQENVNKKNEEDRNELEKKIEKYKTDKASNEDKKNKKDAEKIEKIKAKISNIEEKVAGLEKEISSAGDQNFIDKNRNEIEKKRKEISSLNKKIEDIQNSPLEGKQKEEEYIKKKTTKVEKKCADRENSLSSKKIKYSEKIVSLQEENKVLNEKNSILKADGLAGLDAYMKEMKKKKKESVDTKSTEHIEDDVEVDEEDIDKENKEDEYDYKSSNGALTIKDSSVKLTISGERKNIIGDEWGGALLENTVSNVVGTHDGGVNYKISGKTKFSLNFNKPNENSSYKKIHFSFGVTVYNDKFPLPYILYNCFDSVRRCNFDHLKRGFRRYILNSFSIDDVSIKYDYADINSNISFLEKFSIGLSLKYGDSPYYNIGKIKALNVNFFELENDKKTFHFSLGLNFRTNNINNISRKGVDGKPDKDCYYVPGFLLGFKNQCDFMMHMFTPVLNIGGKIGKSIEYDVFANIGFGIFSDIFYYNRTVDLFSEDSLLLGRKGFIAKLKFKNDKSCHSFNIKISYGVGAGYSLFCEKLGYYDNCVIWNLSFGGKFLGKNGLERDNCFREFLSYYNASGKAFGKVFNILLYYKINLVRIKSMKILRLLGMEKFSFAVEIKLEKNLLTSHSLLNKIGRFDIEDRDGGYLLGEMNNFMGSLSIMIGKFRFGNRFLNKRLPILNKFTIVLAYLDIDCSRNISYTNSNFDYGYNIYTEDFFDWYSGLFRSIEINILPLQYKPSSYITFKLDLFKFKFKGKGTLDAYRNYMENFDPSKNLYTFLKENRDFVWDFSIEFSVDLAKMSIENKKKSAQKVDL